MTIARRPAAASGLFATVLFVLACATAAPPAAVATLVERRVRIR